MKKIAEITIKALDNTTITIRHVKKSDMHGVWKNFNEVLEEGIYLPVFTPVYTDWEKKTWYENLKKENEMCLVAEDNGLKPPYNIVGQCELSNLQWEASIHVFSLGIIVKKDYRDHGLGRALIDGAIKEAKTVYNKEKIILSCFSTNDRGIHLYESIGFKRVGVRKKQFYMNSTYYDEIMYELFIDDYMNEHP
ncbi:MAG: GNAT family N-acetyltransferase [Candidatus Lokiarchaeota archaeon]|nr:GNAT family N-acetyltransferase [Candidatus Lokiarchaeota archaeon]